MTIKLHLNVNVRVAGKIGAAANFGVAAFTAEHSIITATRQAGPYSSLAAVEEAGFTIGAAPEVQAWAARVFDQKSAQQVVICRRLASEHIRTALDAVTLENPGGFFAMTIAANTPNEAMAVAAWCEPLSKIACVQMSDPALGAGTASEQQVSTFTAAGTDDGVWSIEARDAWTGATLATASYTAAGNTVGEIATGLRAAWDAEAVLAAISEAAAGAGADVEITFDGLGNGYEFVLVAPGAGTLTESTPAFVQNVGELGSALGYNNTFALYHDNDTEYLDAAWLGRCLGFRVDDPGGAGDWAYQRLVGVSGTRLPSADKTALVAYPVNYYAPVTYTSGAEEEAFTWEGKMLSGRPIADQVAKHLLEARCEEAILTTFLRAGASSRPKISYVEDGIQLVREACLAVMQKLGRALHFANGATSRETGRVCPYVDTPRLSEVPLADKTAGIARYTGECVYAGTVRKVGNPETIGLQIDLTY